MAETEVQKRKLANIQEKGEGTSGGVAEGKGQMGQRGIRKGDSGHSEFQRGPHTSSKGDT